MARLRPEPHPTRSVPSGVPASTSRSVPDQPADNLPIANAGSDQNQSGTGAVTLNGSGSSNYASLNWTLTEYTNSGSSDKTSLLSDAAAVSPTFTPVAAGYVYVAELTATLGSKTSVSRSVVRIHAAASGLTFTDITLGSPSQVDQVDAVYNSGASDPGAGTIVLTSGNPGDINSALDLILWQGVIDSSFDFDGHTHVILECSISAAPAAQYFLYFGLFDGTIGSLRGVYGSVRMSDGSTGAGDMGTAPVSGAAAASFANGGNFTVVHSIDGDNSYPRDILIRSESTNPNDFGRQSRQENPTNFSGSSLSWFFGIGATTSRSGGTFSGIQLKYLAVPTAS